MLAVILLLLLEHAISVRRERLNAVRLHFSPEFKSTLDAKSKLAECHLVVGFMLFAIIVGATLTIVGVVWPADAT